MKVSMAHAEEAFLDMLRTIVAAARKTGLLEEGALQSLLSRFVTLEAGGFGRMAAELDSAIHDPLSVIKGDPTVGATRGPKLSSCRKQGYRARSAGKPAIDCPYPKDLTGQQRLWLAGWLEAEIESEKELRKLGLIRGASDVMLKINFVPYGLQADFYKNGRPAHTRCRDFGGSNPIKTHIEHMTQKLMDVVREFASVHDTRRRKKACPKRT